MSASDDFTPQDDPQLQEALKRCSSATYYAACKFKQRRRAEDLRMVIVGVIERFVDREQRPKLLHGGDSLRLREDLALDSLTMMEVVMIAEEVLAISVSNEELTRLHTLGEVHAFFLGKSATPSGPPRHEADAAGDRGWNLPAVAEQIRQIEANGHSGSGLSPNPARQ